MADELFRLQAGFEGPTLISCAASWRTYGLKESNGAVKRAAGVTAAFVKNKSRWFQIWLSRATRNRRSAFNGLIMRL
jgi:hypothetical protein